MTGSSNSTHVVTVLNRAWQAIQRNHHDVPAVMIVTGRRRHKSENSVRGQHCRDTWHVDGHEGRQAEVWVSGERLGEGGREVMQTLLHEAAHALAGVRGLKDTSNKNRYHNKVFVKLAEELGLTGPGSSGGPALGYSNCAITTGTAEVYGYEIEQLDIACKNFVAPSAPEEEKPKKATIKAFCGCPEGDNEITWTKKFGKKFQAYGVPPVLCGICRQAFVPEDDPEEPTERAGVLVHLAKKADLLKQLTGVDA